MKQILWAVVLVGLTAGSAVAETKPDWNTQYYLCSKEANTLIKTPACSGESCGMFAIFMVTRVNTYIDTCMRAHGYTVQRGQQK